MASINNFQLKSYKSLTSREGYGFTANLYFNNKKIASIQDFATGGEIDFFWDEKTKKDSTKLDEIKKSVEDYFNKNPKTFIYDYKEEYKLQGLLLDLTEDLIALLETEKYFKKMQKKGYSTVISIRYSNRIDSLSDKVHSESDCMIACFSWDEKTKHKVLEDYKPVRYLVYSSLDDFEIKVI